MADPIDQHHLAILGGLDDPELRELIGEFVSDLRTQSDELTALASVPGRSEPSPEAREIAHKIRGLAGSLGFTPLAEVAAAYDSNQPSLPLETWLQTLGEAIHKATTAWHDLIASP
ncbi:Hpt domain-containing protein [Luteolibacter sp. LG18]|uniref:Hpt domain-containing protein n=1 Tax=Luteolibacter sp. LG18 TaxID=2819286 RepID=UPI002B30C779|nr:hypothetical protein llg_43050 [Luteolibacter sp. LG18]